MESEYMKGLVQSEKLDLTRTAYVLLHKDKSHIYPRPDGGPAWSYSEDQMKVYLKILRDDMKIFSYYICELKQAMELVGEVQAELEQAWFKTIVQIRRARTVKERIAIYEKFFNRVQKPHPLLYDAELKRLLKIEQNK